MPFQIKIASTKQEKEKIFELRKKVFVAEQNVATEDEFDEYEDASTHFIVTNDQNEAVGTCRWRNTMDGIKLERFAVDKNYRGQGIGEILVKNSLDHALKNLPSAGSTIYLHAQIQVVDFYSKFGFETTGREFSECNIRHLKMIYQQ
jgi:predicted GNAT family N-acyltransferase